MELKEIFLPGMYVCSLSLIFFMLHSLFLLAGSSLNHDHETMNDNKKRQNDFTSDGGILHGAKRYTEDLNYFFPFPSSTTETSFFLDWDTPQGVMERYGILTCSSSTSWIFCCGFLVQDM
jgi:hypothetical protein